MARLSFLFSLALFVNVKGWPTVDTWQELQSCYEYIMNVTSGCPLGSLYEEKTDTGFQDWFEDGTSPEEFSEYCNSTIAYVESVCSSDITLAPPSSSIDPFVHDCVEDETDEFLQCWQEPAYPTTDDEWYIAGTAGLRAADWIFELLGFDIAVITENWERCNTNVEGWLIFWIQNSWIIETAAKTVCGVDITGTCFRTAEAVADAATLNMEQLMGQCELQDGLIDGAEIEATYENVKRVMYDLSLLWDELQCTNSSAVFQNRLIRGMGCNGIDDDCNGEIDELGEDGWPPEIVGHSLAQCRNAWFTSETEALECVENNIQIIEDCNEWFYGYPIDLTIEADDCEGSVDISVVDTAGNTATHTVTVFIAVDESADDLTAEGVGCNSIDDNCNGLIDECDEDNYSPVIDEASVLNCIGVWFLSEDAAIDCIADNIQVTDDCNTIAFEKDWIDIVTDSDQCIAYANITAYDGCGNEASLTIEVMIDDSDPIFAMQSVSTSNGSLHLCTDDSNDVTERLSPTNGKFEEITPVLDFEEKKNKNSCADSMKVTLFLYSDEFSVDQTDAGIWIPFDETTFRVWVRKTAHGSCKSENSICDESNGRVYTLVATAEAPSGRTTTHFCTYGVRQGNQLINDGPDYLLATNQVEIELEWN